MIVTRFPYQKISKKTINGSRLYACPDGSKLASVTTILDQTKPQENKIALENWRKRVGRTNAAVITKEAADRGTKMHFFLENFMKTDSLDNPNSNPKSIESHKMASQVIKFGFKNVSEFYGSEINLYYPQLYAGTTDVVFLDNGTLTLGDFKQTNKAKKKEWITDYFLQCAAYIECHNNLYGTTIQRGKIMMCSPDLNYQEWVIEGEELQKFKDLWWERVYKYYDNKL